MILFKHSSIFLLGGILSLIVAMGIGRFAYTPILPLMQSDLSFSNAVGGYLATSNYAGYLLGAFLVGVIPVKQHRTFILRLSLVVSILTTASMGLFQSYFIWYGLRFISGISSAIVFVMASGIVLDKLAIRNKLNWSGIFYGGVGLGIFLSSLLIPILNRLYSWEGVWLGLSSVSMLLVLIVWISMKDEPLSFEKTSKQESALCVPPLKWIPWLIVAYGLEGLGYIVTGTFIVSIAKEIPSFHGDATVVWMVVGLAAIPSCIIWSELAKKIGFVKSLVLAMTLQAFGIALPALWVSQIGVVLSALLFGATFMGITTLATTLARQMSPFNSSRIIGILTSIYAGGQMIGPSIAGIISTATQNYDAVLLGAASVVLVGAGLLLTGIRFEKSPEFLKKQI
ncbi:YbfB/YjiJ family MFS transporter [Lysinibacillus sphaericus]|uniref:Major facilitator family transporter n=2 Tax=Lysinibacillus sphaericus TaxID=1421 RepID=A0AAJ5D7N0_LYSSH|nr:YbfB/YjiJ family MFS transporter [Lysinibacillus sphaericus]MED4544404.1 YbfB/YjiJ family MFS transporter [Lysinibacillus sphaericus]GEC84466.1 MFS transporter [Lysinibacillus sphaericus]SUV15330.1 major facilitator family transporter [Lysinibacillus sphaericus]